MNMADAQELVEREGEPPLHERVILTGGTLPEHYDGAYPMSCPRCNPELLPAFTRVPDPDLSKDNLLKTFARCDRTDGETIFKTVIVDALNRIVGVRSAKRDGSPTGDPVAFPPGGHRLAFPAYGPIAYAHLGWKGQNARRKAKEKAK